MKVSGFLSARLSGVSEEGALPSVGHIRDCT